VGAGLNVPPDRATYLARWSRLHGGYDARHSRVVRAWLGTTYVLARPLAAAGVGPDLVTLAAVAMAGLVALLAGAGAGWLWAAAVAAVLSGVLDGLDGAVAVLTDRATRWGYVLDSVADRVGDGLYLVGLWLAGAPAPVCVAGGALTGLQEYARARAGAAGMSEVGVVTVSERPTRVITTAAFLAGEATFGAPWAGVGAWVWAVLGAVGCAQLAVVLRRRLR
jgi:phosphatidylglycerophosphate synthase